MAHFDKSNARAPGFNAHAGEGMAHFDKSNAYAPGCNAHAGEGVALFSSYRVYRIVETGKASASQGKDDAESAARKKRDTLEHVLESLVKGNPTRLAAFNKARGYDTRKPAQLAASIETLADIAQEMLAEAAKSATLREVYADAGLNPSLEQTARAEAQRLVGAKGAHGQKITEKAANSDALNTLDGRLWFELLALKRATDEARSEGRKVPEIKLEQLDRRRKDKKPAAAPSASNGVTATVHPSSILREPDEATRRAEFERFVQDLKKIAKVI